MAWIKQIGFEQATGRLKQLYDRVTGPDNNVDNIMMIHSLRPHTMEGHMAIYKSVLHHTGNNIPKWFLETIGTYVSFINKCDYCFEHHFVGLIRNLADDDRADAIRAAIVKGELENAPLDTQQLVTLEYAKKLTLEPSTMVEEDIKKLRTVGYDDGEILEINQVTAYFSYANRTVLGLGCSLDGDIIGLSPNNSDDPNDWNHS
jgi:uncharacterized peroxidase-related enzyme